VPKPASKKMKVKLQIRGKQFPQTADIEEAELQKILIAGTNVEWFNVYKTKKGEPVRHRHITINDPNAVIQDIEFMDNALERADYDEIPEE
jgi:hypothetical protein